MTMWSIQGSSSLFYTHQDSTGEIFYDKPASYFDLVALGHTSFRFYKVVNKTLQGFVIPFIWVHRVHMH